MSSEEGSIEHNAGCRGSGQPGGYKENMAGAVTRSQRFTNGTAVRAVVAVGIVVRVVAAVILIVGPWTDEPKELSDWDIERFTVIATEDGRAWRDHPVEYPPGSVVVFETLVAGDDEGANRIVVGAHRRLVVVTLLADLALAWLLSRRNREVAATYLALGLPLIPMGLLRLDIIVALLATGAAMAALGLDRQSASNGPPGSSSTSIQNSARSSEQIPPRIGAMSAVLTASAVLTKVWPGFLIPAFWALRRDKTAVASITATAVGAAAWLLWADSGLDPIRQVVDLRGATGWHIESTGGVITALADSTGLAPISGESPVTFQLNAFRIGTLSPLAVTTGRVMTVVVALALAWRIRSLTSSPSASPPDQNEILARLGAFMLGTTALLLATAPLLSPQFVLWLIPWAAMVMAGNRIKATSTIPAPVAITALVAVVTG